ncbi:MAG: serine/threonine-protein phosphatase [Clostridia bacterium]|nr:serine/threonine-protein phosphatase [Clostridia bacterium]
MKKKKGTTYQPQPQPPVQPSLVTVELGRGRVTLGNAQHCGARPYQEDSFGFSSIDRVQTLQKGLLAVLADGMGGLQNGKAVSNDTVMNLLNWFNNPLSVCRTAEDLQGAVRAINNSICDVYCSDGRISSGSTIVCALVQDGLLHWLCIGDSRLYLKRNGRLHPVNEDHDYLNQLLEQVLDGTLPAAEAFADPNQERLAECIGKRDIIRIDYSKRGYRLQNGDSLVLCSDGVYNALTPTEFAAMITEDPMASCDNIVRQIAAKGLPHQDNNTIIVLNYKE